MSKSKDKVKKAKRKTKGGYGKRKGSAFERLVCKQLSQWVSHGKQDDLFWRSAMSGGRATFAASQGKKLINHAGDIVATSPLGNLLLDEFMVECKFYNTLRFDLFFLQSQGILQRFWRRAVKDGRKFGKQPMLIVKQNNFGAYMLVPRGCFADLVQDVSDLPMVRIMRWNTSIDVALLDHVLQCRFRGNAT